MLLDNLNVILVRTRFPENIGMAARACANMGCPQLCLVNPERWDRAKALPLATEKGIPLLDSLRVYKTLPEALADRNMAFASTARLGGWRKTICQPRQAGEQIAAALSENEKISLVFGPEDKGLANDDIIHCQSIIHINTYGASSLNLAQAVLLILYECAEHAGKTQAASTAASAGCAGVTLRELDILENEFRQALMELDCLHGKNPDYHFIQWHNLFGRMRLKRHEFDALMGFCRQIRNRIKIKIK